MFALKDVQTGKDSPSHGVTWWAILSGSAAVMRKDSLISTGSEAILGSDEYVLLVDMLPSVSAPSS